MDPSGCALSTLHRTSEGVLCRGRASTAFDLTQSAVNTGNAYACLGAVFGGQTGLFGGVAIAPDGSKINAVALTALSARKPDGSLVIPSPQIEGNGVDYGVLTTMRSE